VFEAVVVFAQGLNRPGVSGGPVCWLSRLA